MNLACPVCHMTLHPHGDALHCDKGHAFDRAREGYINLLPVQFRKSQVPGDPPAMVDARRRFLDAGHYSPLRDAVTVEINRVCASQVSPVVVDIGCGEGYYTSAWVHASRNIIGVDISKTAVKAAARRYPDITWVVAGSARVPIENRCADLVVSMFAPFSIDELSRLSKPDAVFVVVSPAEGHLIELRSRLFDEVREHRPERQREALSASHTLTRSVDVAYARELGRVDIGHLLDMTPYAWRAKPERVSALKSGDSFAVSMHFRVDVWNQRASLSPHP